MSWSNIREIQEYNFVEIGNHSHTHDYLIDFNDNDVKNDLTTSINIFKERAWKKFRFFFISIW